MIRVVILASAERGGRESRRKIWQIHHTDRRARLVRFQTGVGWSTTPVNPHKTSIGHLEARSTDDPRKAQPFSEPKSCELPIDDV